MKDIYEMEWFVFHGVNQMSVIPMMGKIEYDEKTSTYHLVLNMPKEYTKKDK